MSAADKDSCPHMLEDKLYGKKNEEGVEQVKQELKMLWGVCSRLQYKKGSQNGIH